MSTVCQPTDSPRIARTLGKENGMLGNRFELPPFIDQVKVGLLKCGGRFSELLTNCHQYLLLYVAFLPS